MEKPPKRRTLELVNLKTRNLWKIATVRAMLEAGAYDGQVPLYGAVDKLVEVLANDPFPHRPKRRG